ncbi:MAG: hypothetical protein NZM07_06570 [Elioraea sp.]|nr:hypothetical protein [Elioraea sp.]
MSGRSSDHDAGEARLPRLIGLARLSGRTPRRVEDHGECHTKPGKIMMERLAYLSKHLFIIEKSTKYFRRGLDHPGLKMMLIFHFLSANKL